METFEVFKKQQVQTLEVLKDLLDFLREGGEFGVAIDPKFELKLETGIKTTADEKLKVALIGGFSEGKTSIAAAWAEKYDKNTMKIGQQESSDEVVKYQLGDFDLYDTPGLFGSKETAAKEKYKDITKKYVSEAHLILYVMNPNNPIKESHKEALVWLFKDLKLLSRTVFVLSRFDEEVDIEDEDDYRKGFDIKRRNIIGRLRDFGLLDNDEEVSIVAVSANPFGESIDYWLLHLDEFKKLSHIGLLQEATTEKISAAGNASALVEASKKSIASDILMRELPVAIERDEKINAECERLSDACSDVKEDLEKTKSNLNETRIALRAFIVDLFTNLIRQAKGLDMDTVVDFFEQNIGSEGIVLNTTIQSEFERQLGSAYHEIDRMEISLDSVIKQYNNVIRESIGTYVKEGIKGAGQFLKAGVNITTESVKAARNFIIPAFKFKPWGAVKLASGLNKAIPIFGQVLGIVIDVGESIYEAVKKKEFKKGIDNLVSIFDRQRSEYVAFIDNENEFTRKCFPSYVALQKKVEELMAELREKKAQHEKFRRWREQGEAIEAEFKIIL